MAEATPYATYDKDIDILTVTFLENETAYSTRTLDDRRMIDLTDDGRVISVEFVDASTGIDLSEIPFRQEIERLIRRYHFPTLTA